MSSTTTSAAGREQPAGDADGRVAARPATTCAAVTTRFRPREPAAALDADAARGAEDLDDAGGGGPDRRIAQDALARRQRRRLGPTIDGNGSMRASRLSRRARRQRGVELPHDLRALRPPGESASARGRAARPTRRPRRSRAPSRRRGRSRRPSRAARNGVSRRPPRMNEPATSAATARAPRRRTRRRAPRPASTASSSRRSEGAARRASRRTRRAASPTSESALGSSPRRKPPTAETTHDRDRDPVDGVRAPPPQSKGRATMPRPRGRSSVG